MTSRQTPTQRRTPTPDHTPTQRQTPAPDQTPAQRRTPTQRRTPAQRWLWLFPSRYNCVISTEARRSYRLAQWRDPQFGFINRHRIRQIPLALILLLPSATRAQQSTLDRDFAAAQQTLASGDLDGARRQFSILSHAHPEIAELHATLGALLFQQGQFPEALRELEAARRLKPSLPNLDGLIAMSNVELGHNAEAIPALESTFRDATEPPVKRQSGLELERAYTATREDAKAVAVALELQQLFPDDPEILYHNERIFGNFAYLTVQQLAKAAPDSTWRYQAEAEAQESQGAHDASIASYQKVLALAPNRPGVHYRLGRVFRERARDNHHPDDLLHAMQEFQAELKLDPDSANASYEIAELDRLAGNLAEARTYFERALSHYPGFPEANLGLGTVLDAQKQPAAALPYLERAAKADPNDEATWYRLSQVHRALGQKSEQQAALQHFLQLHQTTQPNRAATDTVTHQTIDPTPALPSQP